MRDITFYPLDGLPKDEVEKLIPVRATERSLGYDLKARLSDKLYVYPEETVLIPTGYCVRLSTHVGGFVLPRSSIKNTLLSIPNSPGLIDPDYSKEIKVIFRNTGSKIEVIQPYERIAQMVFIYTITRVRGALELENKRIGGFGSTNETQ